MANNKIGTKNVKSRKIKKILIRKNKNWHKKHKNFFYCNIMVNFEHLLTRENYKKYNFCRKTRGFFIALEMKFKIPKTGKKLVF